MADQNKPNNPDNPTGRPGGDDKIGSENWQQGQTDTNRQGNSPGDKQTDTRNRQDEESGTSNRQPNR
jgi:hypothetical protein